MYMCVSVDIFSIILKSSCSQGLISIQTPYFCCADPALSEELGVRHREVSCGTGLPRWRSWKRICLAMQETQETQVRSLGQEDPLEEGMAAHSSVLSWLVGSVHGVAKTWTQLKQLRTAHGYSPQ